MEQKKTRKREYYILHHFIGNTPSNHIGLFYKGDAEKIIKYFSKYCLMLQLITKSKLFGEKNDS